MIKMIDGKCKFCNKAIRFSMGSKLSEMMYCSNECWKNDWARNGDGLIHPDYKNLVLNHGNKYGGKDVVNEIYMAIK